MLQIPASQRLAYVLSVIENEKMRFPNAEISKRLEVDEGNLSNMLNGKKPIPDKFFTSFLRAYPTMPPKWLIENQPLEIGDVRITIKDYIDLLTQTNERYSRIIDQIYKGTIQQEANSAHQSKTSKDAEPMSSTGSDPKLVRGSASSISENKKAGRDSLKE